MRTGGIFVMTEPRGWDVAPGLNVPILNLFSNTYRRYQPDGALNQAEAVRGAEGDIEDALR
jgi:hypothetical protein